MSAIRHALTVKREDDFAAWYQEVISAADNASRRLNILFLMAFLDMSDDHR